MGFHQKKVYPKSSPDVFVTGSIAKHLIVNTFVVSAGMFMIFFADAINIYFIGLLRNPTSIAAIGFSLPILLFVRAFAFAFMSVLPPITGKFIGAQQFDKAANSYYTIMIFACLLSLIIGVIVGQLTGITLTLMGVTDNATYIQAHIYTIILTYTLPLTVLSLINIRSLQTYGKITESSIGTFLMGSLNVIFDYLFIIQLHFGVEGAAISTVLSRSIVLIFTTILLLKTQNIPYGLTWNKFKVQVKNVLKFFIPSLLINANLPINMYVLTTFLAAFGVQVVASWAVIARLYPLILLLSISSGQTATAIVGQNLGANQFKRIKETFITTWIFITVTSSLATVLINLFSNDIIIIFHIPTGGQALFHFFTIVLLPLFVVGGIGYIVNFLLMTVGSPNISSIISWSTTLLTILFIFLLKPLFGANGVLLANNLSIIITAYVGVTFFLLKLKNLQYSVYKFSK